MARATRKTQPYRAGKTPPPGPVADAMKRGAPAVGANPMDLKRKLAAKHHAHKRAAGKRPLRAALARRGK